MIGKTLGPYEILEPLGAGGMGEVYLGEDTRLGRKVAIKVLPPEFAADPERLARFEQEAKLLASLNHPNIAAVYGLEDEGDTRFIAMELVEGETLAERLRSQGRLDVDEALDVARQIAEGLEAAHESGVIHRDLKPANVKITPAGKVKVLDFGLAKAFEAEAGGGAPDMSNSPTMAAATQAGVIMGTAAYMSPEQARGKPVDRRTDIWAFGCVLYEMLAGRAPFQGETVTDVLAAVVKEEPDFDRLAAEAAGGVRHLVHRCLSKDPHQRLQHIGDARIEIAAPRPDAPVEGAPGAPLGFSVATVAAVGVAAAVLGAVAVWALKPPSEKPPAPLARFSFAVPDGLRIVGNDPEQDGPWFPYVPFALSSDGSKLAYLAVASDAPEGERQLYLRSRDAIDARPLSGTTNADMPFFSPDGDWVGFWANGTLYRVSVDGGPPVAIADVPLRPRGAAWASEDTIVLGGVNRGLSVVSSSGDGVPEEITTPDTERGDHYHAWPSMLPGGDAFLFTAVAETSDDVLGLYSLRDGNYTLLERPRGVTQGHYLDSGHLVFFRSGSLFAAPFDPQSPRAIDEEFPILEVATGWAAGMFLGLFDVSLSGSLVHGRAADVVSENTIVIVDDEGEEERIPGLDPGGYTYRPAISPDGTRIVVSNIAYRRSTSDLLVLDLVSGTQHVLTRENANIWPLWSVDATEVFFARFADESFDLAVQSSTDDQAAPRLLFERPYDDIPTDLSDDGRWLAYERRTPTAGLDIWLTSLEDEPSPREWLATPANEAQAVISPNGRYIAYTSDASAQRQIYVRPFSGDGDVLAVSVDGGRSPRWSADGTELFFLREPQCLSCDNTMMSAAFDLEPDLQRRGAPRELFQGRYDPFFDVVTAGPFFVPGSTHFVMLPREVLELGRLDWVLNWSTDVSERVSGR